MLLVTTADQRSWDINRRILFLGEWCRKYSERSVWETIQYKVLPYHWDDRSRLFADYNRIQSIYEKYLRQIAAMLNEFHEVDYSLRYWRILVGPWLQYFVSIVYDRYCSIENAMKQEDISDTLLLDFSTQSMIPMHMADFSKFFISDEWNHFIYGQLINEFDDILFNIEKKRADFLFYQVPASNKTGQKINFIENTIPKITSVINKGIPDCFKKYIFFKSYLGIKEDILLQIMLCQLPVYYAISINSVSQKTVNLQKRNSIQLKSYINHFERCLSKLIPFQIPTVYLEDFKKLKEQAFRILPDNPKMIFTSNAFMSNDVFKCWSAEQAENRGTKLIAGQHGGHYGSGLWNGSEDHEIKISNAYFSFGWVNNKQKKVVPLPAVKFERLLKLKPDRNGNILMASTSMSRYSYCLYSMPISSQILDYIHCQQQFVKNLKKRVKDILLLRLYPGKYGWDERIRWETLNLGIEIYQGNASMVRQLKLSRLFIGTYNATTFLETFYNNFPTIIFWDPKHWELRPSAQPLYDELKRVGIFHDTPESAAALVNDIYDDPFAWWSQSHIQAVKNQFCSTFAKPAKGIKGLKDWRGAIKSVLCAG